MRGAPLRHAWRAGVNVGERAFTLERWDRHPGVLLGRLTGGGPLYTVEQLLPWMLAVQETNDRLDPNNPADDAAAVCWARLQDKLHAGGGVFRVREGATWEAAPLPDYISACKQLSGRIAAEAGVMLGIEPDLRCPADYFANLARQRQRGQDPHTDNLGTAASMRFMLSVIFSLLKSEGAGRLMVRLPGGGPVVYAPIDVPVDFVVLGPGVEHLARALPCSYICSNKAWHVFSSCLPVSRGVVVVPVTCMLRPLARSATGGAQRHGHWRTLRTSDVLEVHRS